MTNYSQSNWNRNNRKPQLDKFLTNLFSNLGQKTKNLINPKKWSGRKIFKWTLYIGGAFLLAGSILFAVVSFSLPDPNKINSRIVAQSTKIYARDGNTVLYEIHGDTQRTLVELKDIPDHVKQATIAIEDKDFYTNGGIDVGGILRAAFKNVRTGDLTGEGGSTITQQFVKNAVLSAEKESTFEAYTRKVKEVILAIELEQRFTKDEILQLYLNEIPYGGTAYGIEAAAKNYFTKNAKDLKLSEAAYLAAIVQRPSYYSPSGPNLDKLEIRKNFVLDLMAEQGYINEQQRDEAKAEKVSFAKVRDTMLAEHFVHYVQQILAEKYGEKTLEEGGLKVITTLDWNMQQIADKAVKDGVARNEKGNKANNAGLVAIDPRNGQIMAMVGSKDYYKEEIDGQVNVTVRPLQPGSSIKPYVYATGFKEGMSPATMLIDVKTVFGTFGGKEYAPSNYNGASSGPLSIRKALAGSLNVPAVKTLALVGVQDAINTMQDMGLTSTELNTDVCGLSLVLGGCEITLLDHTSAMGVFANMGVRYDDTPILKVTDSKGDVLEEWKDDGGEEVIDPQVAFEIVSIMTDNDARSYIFGSRSPLILSDRPVGAKTGTTQLWKDGWTMGYTPSLAAGVWTGNTDGTAMRAGADGVVTAAPIWNQFMREALKGTPAEQFKEPSGIQHINVDSVSGKLPTEYTPNTKNEVFASFAIPKDSDDVHVPVRINRLNGKLATEQTPSDLIETRVYTVLHSEMPENSNWEEPVKAWAQAAGLSVPPTEKDDGSVNPGQLGTQVRFVTPQNNQEIQTMPFAVQVEVTGSKPQSVELYLEGDFIGRKDDEPYSFNITDANNGWQTLMAIVTMPTGDTIQNSIRVYINSN